MKKMLEHNSFFKRVLSLALVLVMVLGMVPSFAVHASEGTTLYLKPNENWEKDNARFAVYYWNDSENHWLDMTDEDGDGYYQAEIPAGYSDIIFCRMNPGTTDNNWNDDTKWNQTNNLSIPTEMNCYTVLGDSWSYGEGEWSVYTPASTEPSEPETSEPSVPETTEPEATEPATGSVYVVAGVEALTGALWNGDPAAVPENVMTSNGDGTYTKVFHDVPVGENYQLKVVENAADGTQNWIGDETGNNVTFHVTAVCDVTVTIDSATWKITVSGDGVAFVTTLDVQAMYAVGNGEGNWLNGEAWGVDAEANKMTETSTGVYEITFHHVEAFDNYQVKFAANGTWTDSWGASDDGMHTSGTYSAVYNGDNICLTLEQDSDVTLKIDLTNFNYETKQGATFTLTIQDAEGGDPEPDPEQPTYPEVPAGYNKVTLHFLKPDTWGSKVNAWIWANDSDTIPGYEAYHSSWPGSAIPANADHAGWYDMVVATAEPQAFKFIFNDGGNQTADLYTGEITGETELWIVGNTVYTEEPGAWKGEYHVKLHFQKPESFGDQVDIYAWQGDEKILGVWPGSLATENTSNAGWYDASFTRTSADAVNFIFNDGAGNQTSDLSTGTLSYETELWVVGESVLSSAPEGWNNPNRKVYVPGTFPGPSWTANSNEMTFDSDLGLYTYTFENVPAANYEYKIAINGTWDENYGAGGVAGGSNIAVTVPETMDVTVYYNDQTHNSVTSVDYIFADITLSGIGIADTKLTDKGLTGIYSATVSMAAGTYSDLTVSYNDEDASFPELVLEEAKDVTFYMDPVTGIHYHNGSDVPIEEDAIYFNSQDLTYKAPFGAVEQKEEVCFSIATGEDIIDAVLVVKGVGSYSMTQGEDNLWSVKVSFAKVGEYDYYFVLSNGASVVVYGDDDGYYGEGKTCQLTEVMPYDLVVYTEGYETPDWMKNAVIYQIFPDRFFDGDLTNNQAQTWARGEVDYEYITNWYTLPENPEQEELLDKDTYLSTGAHYGDGEWSNEIYGGDIQGIIQRIDYLDALGVNVIYLNPVFWSISNHRYDAVDYTKIDPILGDLGDFAELVAVAEEHDMHIILDGVFNHVSDDSVYFDRYYKFLTAEDFDGKLGAYPYWAYVYDYMAAEGVTQSEAETAAKAYFQEEYDVTDFSYTEWFAVSSSTMAGTVDNIGLRAGKEVYSYEGWWGYDSMPVIYSTNGSEYQTGNWAEEIIDGEDSVTKYWISQGSNGWRLDVANEVSDETWQHFRESVKALDSDAVIIGEIWDDATKYLMGDMYDSVMNYLFRNAVTSFAMGKTNGEDTTKAMEKIRERYPEEAFYAMMNLVGSHDTSRILSYLDGIDDDRNQKDLESAFPTYETTSDTAKARQHLVSFLQFTYAGAPTIYYGDEIGMVGADDPDDRRAMEWGKGSQELVEWYATLAAIREAYPALRTGDVEVFSTGDDHLMGYRRTLNGKTVVVLANNSSTAQTYAQALLEDCTDVLSGTTYAATDSSYVVPAYSGLILVPNEDVQELELNLDGLKPGYDSSYVVERCDGTNHIYVAVVTKPTCTAGGYTTYTCACGESYVSDYTDPADHFYGEGVIYAPTCTTDGYTGYTCVHCGAVYATDIVPATGHHHDAVVTEPTCTEDGYTTHTCACGDSYVDSIVPATGHQDKLIDSKDPTCEENGYELWECEHCHKRHTETVAATGHHYVDGKCEFCGKQDPSTTTPVHNFMDWLKKWIKGWTSWPKPLT